MIEVTVKGGLPLLAEVEIQPKEPDVGIFSEYIDEIRLYWRGSEKEVTRKFYDSLTKNDWDGVEEQIWKTIKERRCYGDY
jgi:hypothetical protein